MFKFFTFASLIILTGCSSFPKYQESFDFRQHIILKQNNVCTGFLYNVNDYTNLKDKYISAKLTKKIIIENHKEFSYLENNSKVSFFGIRNDSDLDNVHNFCKN